MGKMGYLLVSALMLPLTGTGPAGLDPWWFSQESAITAAHRESCRLELIGRSGSGGAINAIWISAPNSGGSQRNSLPTVAVVAGIDGRHVVGTRVALGLAEKLAADHPDVLRNANLVVIGCLNPDGVAAFESAAPKVDDGANAARRKTARDDADRDRLIDEDGALDVNGDGVITQMRVKNPRAGLSPGLAATDIAEPDEPRLLRRADANKGERAEWAVLTEGRDQDGDGSIAEDGPEGVDLDKNFPYHWPETDASAGPTPLSEPESLAIAKWLLDHPNICAVVVYEPNDNLINLPANGKMDATEQSPISNGVLDDDKPLYERVAGKFKDVTKITGVGGVTRSFDGSLQGWSYAQLGIASFATPVWVRPDLVKKEEEKKKDEGKKDEGKKDDKPRTPERKVVDSDDGKWLALSDKRVAEGLPPGFLDWKPFHHPQLGDVEIGGWVPGFRFNPPDAEIPALVDQQAKFVTELVGMLPKLEVEGPFVERVGERTWRVRTSAVNVGGMPTRLAMGVRTHRLAPTRWELDLPAERVVSGERKRAADSIAGTGGRLDGEWVVVGEAGSEIKLWLRSPECGDRELTIRLEANNAAAPQGNP